MLNRPKITLIFSPDVISLFFLRLKLRGRIYYTETDEPIGTRVIQKLAWILRFLDIHPFEYRVGVGSFGQGYVNSLLRRAQTLTAAFTDSCKEKKIIGQFNRRFATRNFELVWKKYISLNIWSILKCYHGVLNNYSPESVIFIPADSCEAFVFENYTPEGNVRKPEIRIFHKRGTNIINFSLYLGFLLKGALFCGVRIGSVKKREYKVMVDAARWVSRERTFGILEWWDGTAIKKDEILMFSTVPAAGRRVSYFQDAQRMGFHCVELKAGRRIPLAQSGRIIRDCIIFPLKIALLLGRSNHSNIFFFFLTEFFHWFSFFCYYRVKLLIAITPSIVDYQTIICNLFGCSTAAFHTSYLGGFDNFKNRHIHVNHLFLWGDIQTDRLSNALSVDKFYFSGCHALTNFDRRKREAFFAKYPGLRPERKNIVFFDNRVIKDASTTEEGYFDFLKLILRCFRAFELNVIYRPKESQLFDERHFSNKTMLGRIRKDFEDTRIPVLTRMDYDVTSVISLADIVVQNMVGTPSMLARMLDIPAFSYYRYIEETPDPIMRQYLNELVFDNQQKLLEKIRKVTDGEEFPCLREEDKKRINHHLDNKGLLRLRSKIGEIVR